MTTTPPPAPESSTKEANQVELCSQLRTCLKSLSRREPLEHTYEHLLRDGIVTPRRSTLRKDKTYKVIDANLRQTVTKFTEHPWDRIAQREPLDDDAMRAAFTLRKDKEHEQKALLSATLLARNPRDYAARKRKLEGMAMALQQKKPKEKKKPSLQKQAAAEAVSEDACRRAEQERLEKQRAREAAHRQQQEEEARRREDEERLARMHETPQLKLKRAVQPLFQTLWDMEFANLLNTNPFRIVIDASNCATMGAPDYMDVIDTPMNLTYIRDKMQAAKYNTLQEFISDVNLMLSNALKYNTDPNNPYHIDAKEMKKVFVREAKKLVADLQKGQARK